MEGYYFNEALLRNLANAMEMKVRSLIAEIDIPENTWRGWRRAKDIPITGLVKICNALRIPVGHFICTGQSPAVMIGRRNYQRKEDEFKMVRFLNQEFGEEVTNVQGRIVIEFCRMVGISPNTFYRYFRNAEEIPTGLGVKTWLAMCNKTRTYPMDFFTGVGLNIPVIAGFSRHQIIDKYVLTKRNIDLLSHNAQLIRALEQEKARTAKLETELAKLREELGAKRIEKMQLEEELDSHRMRAAESDEATVNG